jgi:hypothetical protein
MKLTAAASSSLRAVLTGPARPARWLGATPAALYLATAAGPSVAGSGVTGPGAVGLLARDATRLPCGLLLAGPAAELPLTALAPPGDLAAAGCLIGGGLVQWTGAQGPVIVSVVREWSPPRPPAGEVVPAALAEVHGLLPSAAAAGLDGALLAVFAAATADLTADPRPRVDAGLTGGLAGPLTGGLTAVAGGRVTTAQLAGLLLGRGPGLTPAGDDLLAGFLLGARTFGLPASGLHHAIAALAPARTTALSAALLRHAADGECIDEVAELAAALTGRAAPGPAVRQLLSVGRTSGAALAWGLVVAAQRSATPAQPATSARPPRVGHDPIRRKSSTTWQIRHRPAEVCPVVGAIGPITRHSASRPGPESGKSAPPLLARTPMAEPA